MKRTLVVASACLILATGLAQGQNSPPYNPRTGVYTLDYDDDPPKSKKDKAASKPSTQSEKKTTRWKQVNPPGYSEQQRRVDEEVARYEKRYQQRIAEEEARAAEARQRKAEEERRKEEAKLRKEEAEALGREIGRNIDINVWAH